MASRGLLVFRACLYIFYHNRVRVIFLSLFFFLVLGSFQFQSSQALAEFQSEYRTHRLELHSKYGPFMVEVHYPLNKWATANQVRNIIKKDFMNIVNYFKAVPQTAVHLSLLPRAQVANGMATVFPQNLIYLHDFPPYGNELLTSSKDWLRTLVIHEFIHIIHHDQTRGIVDALRYVFGSTVKFGGVVPRWFTEGLAVWAETEFSDEGRLRSLNFEYNFLQVFLANKNCESIACLDDPGIYPYGKLAYWAGAYFLSYIESLKPDSLSCIVRSNSGYVPFFLNSSFKACTGKTAQLHFKNFRERVLLRSNRQMEQFISAQSELNLTPINLELAASGGKIQWEKGVGLINDLLVFAWKDDYSGKESMRSFDLNRQTFSELQFTNSLEQIQFTDPYEDEFSAITFRNFEREQVKKRYLISISGNQILRSFRPKGTHLYRVDDDDYVHLAYDNQSWQLKKLNHYGKENSNPLLTFPKFHPVLNPTLSKQQDKKFLSYLSVENKEHSLYTINLTEGGGYGDRFKLYSSASPLTYLGSCQKKVLLKEKGREERLILIQFDDYLEKATKTTMEAKWIAGLLSIQMGKNFSVTRWKEISSTPYTFKGGCEAFIDKLKSRSYLTQEHFRPHKSPFKVPTEQAVESQFKVGGAYPSARHFIPRFLLLNLSSSGSDSGVELSTALQDPFGHHSINLAGTYWGQANQVSPQVSYLYNKNRKHFKMGYKSKLAEAFSGSKAELYHSFSSVLGRRFPIGPTDFSTEIFGQKSRENDLVSKRDFLKTGLLFNFSFSSPFRDRFLNSFDLNLNGHYQHTNGKNSFYGMKTKLGLGLKLHWRHGLSWILSYGRLFKDDLESGVLYGGGASGDPIFGNTGHPFYGLASGDLFGNYIHTSMLEYEGLAFRPYQGIGLVPLYFKEFSFIAGSSWANSDFIYFDKNIIRRDSIYGFHGGIRLKTTLFYLMPAQFDLLWSQVYHLPKDHGQLLFLFKSSLF